ncbi:DHHC zinc finger domain-containing protein [Babesia ovis]|uniref:Palmitoyltransferase n=1 Tax=Babesia ovis TaxID=5869 RepID=A0A9W5TD99_BABOV|nr:DHHC zinc finger domain-containing protein [Babesia ovis]
MDISVVTPPGRGAGNDVANHETRSLRNCIIALVGTVKDKTQRIVDDERVIKVVSAILLYVPVIAFMATSMGWFNTFTGPAVSTVTLIIAALGLGCYHIVSCAEPGIIPRLADTYEAFDAIRMRRKYSHVPSCIEVAISGKFLRVKYCHTCNIYRPPRSVHCSVCDVCVHRFDHHCKWLGNCIGGNNHKAFYGFLAFTFTEGLILFSLCIARIAVISLDNKDVTKVALSATLLAYVVLAGWFVAGLMLYHTYLICFNKTTNEQLKALYADYNPWDRGVIRNIKETLFARTKLRPLYSVATVARPIYDPGRSFPKNFKATYGTVQHFAADRRLAFDIKTNEDWKGMENIPEDNEITNEGNKHETGNEEISDVEH